MGALAVNCIENGPNIHPRGAYCLINYFQVNLRHCSAHARSKHVRGQIIHSGAMTVNLP